MTSVMSRRTVAGGLCAALLAPGRVSAQNRVEDSGRARRARLQRLQAVKSWGYQLRYIDFSIAARSAHDLLVLDATQSRQLRYVRDYLPEEVARAQMRPDGGRRIVLSYLSIGEAERYRPYWDAAHQQFGGVPPWLGPVNPKWAENYPVRFWDADWQKRMFGSAEASLDRIVSQGFDGVYLDRADVYSEWAAERTTAEADMAAFVTALAAYARRLRPDFLVVMQNAEELAERQGVLTALDGIAKEDLWYGLDFKEGVNPAREVADSLSYLRKARKAGLAILAVEYVSDPAKLVAFEVNARRERFVPHVADRTLFRLNEPPISAFRPIEGEPPPP